MKLQIEENSDDFTLENIKTEWETLCDNSVSSTPFQYPQWLIPWWKFFGGSNLKIVSIRENGTLIGLGLFYIYQDQLQIKRCCIVGTGISDYLDVPIAVGKEQICGDLLIDYLKSIQSQWDECDFQELRKKSFLFMELSKKITVRPVPCSVCLSKTISDKPDQILYSIQKKLRNNLRRAEKRIFSSGSVEFIEEPEDCIEESLQNLITLHGARWNYRNYPGVLNDEKVQMFHCLAIKELYKKNLIRIFSLKLDKEVIASYYIFLHKKNAFAYLGGFNPEMVEYSPGILSLYYIMERVAKKGYNKIDFLRGDEEYKRYWLPIEGTNYRFRFSISALRNR